MSVTAWWRRAPFGTALLITCGARTAAAHHDAPLAPRDLWHGWSFEPAVLVGLALSAALYAVGVRALWRRAGKGRGVSQLQVAAFTGGWLTLVVALVSPLHRLGGALFSAHMAQHELLMAVAAPLLVLSRPLVPFLWAIPPSSRRRVGEWTRPPAVRAGWTLLSTPAVAWSLHAIAIWAWHAPPLYQAALRSDAVHTAQHLSFLGTALLFWWALGHGRAGRMGYGAAVLYLFATAVHTTALGAILTIGTASWYPAYAGAAAWGLTPLEDQQLAGLIMWVPGNVAYLVAALTFAAAWLRESDTRLTRGEHRALTASLDEGRI